MAVQAARPAVEGFDMFADQARAGAGGRDCARLYYRALATMRVPAMRRGFRTQARCLHAKKGQCRALLLLEESDEVPLSRFSRQPMVCSNPAGPCMYCRLTSCCVQDDGDIFAAAPAGAARRGLLDNYDDAEGYYNFQVRPTCRVRGFQREHRVEAFQVRLVRLGRGFQAQFKQ